MRDPGTEDQSQSAAAEVKEGGRTQLRGVDLDGRRDLRLVIDSQDRAALVASVGRGGFWRVGIHPDEVTVALVSPDLGEVWASETSTPGSIWALYTRVL